MSGEELAALRGEIDAINAALLPLLVDRLRVSGAIGAYKAGQNLPVRDPAREEAMLFALLADCDPALRPYVERCFRALIDAGCDYQTDLAEALRRKEFRE